VTRTAAVPTRPAARRRPTPTETARLLPASGGPTYREHLDRVGPLPAAGPGLIQEVLESGLRGRGGAGFPTGRKMVAVRGRRGPAVVVANGTEGEPLSAKDRVLLARNPHLVLDGLVAVGAALRGDRIIIAVERARQDTVAALRHALVERPDHGPVIELVQTPSRYIAGQETALVRWINGGEARPVFGNRIYERGVAGRPTLVDNVETLAHVGLIARFGAGWFRLIGPPAEPGSMLVTVTGGVDRPGVYEVPIGSSLTQLLGQVGARRVQALLVGGYFGTWVGGERIAAVPLSAEGLATVGSRPGCGVIVALPDDVCAWAEVATVAEFYSAHSAGQCGPCVFGLEDIARAVRGVLAGDPEAEAAARHWTAMVKGRGACHLPDGAAGFVESALDVFGGEIADHRLGRCQRPHHGYLPSPAPGDWR
jgi:NADH:ubiquinone oxidoreductase subunit F (NADH-binding)